MDPYDWYVKWPTVFHGVGSSKMYNIMKVDGHEWLHKKHRGNCLLCDVVVRNRVINSKAQFWKQNLINSFSSVCLIDLLHVATNWLLFDYNFVKSKSTHFSMFLLNFISRRGNSSPFVFLFSEVTVNQSDQSMPDHQCAFQCCVSSDSQSMHFGWSE